MRCMEMVLMLQRANTRSTRHLRPPADAAHGARRVQRAEPCSAKQRSGCSAVPQQRVSTSRPLVPINEGLRPTCMGSYLALSCCGLM